MATDEQGQNQVPVFHHYAVTAEMPRSLYYQVQAFDRIVWGESVEHNNIDAALDEEVQHFVIAQGNRLIAHADLCYVTLELGGASYLCGGIGGVMTFPAFRKRGYGRQLVQNATEAIRQNTDADIGLLWTEPHNRQFYEHQGWQVMPNLTTLIGDPSAPRPFDAELRMMIFVSQKAKDARLDFEDAQLYVGADHW